MKNNRRKKSKTDLLIKIDLKPELKGLNIMKALKISFGYLISVFRILV